jgi:anaerobic magnesium-protoporphyrin IX monomethyl ester cyclase
LKLDRWTWSIYSPLPGSALYEELIAEGRIEPYRLDYHQVHFTEAYEGICDIPPARLKELYREINDHFYRRDAAASPLAQVRLKRRILSPVTAWCSDHRL